MNILKIIELNFETCRITHVLHINYPIIKTIKIKLKGNMLLLQVF